MKQGSKDAGAKKAPEVKVSKDAGAKKVPEVKASKDAGAKKAPEVKVPKREVQKEKPSKKSSFLERIQRFKEYLLLSRLELRKVSWPTLKETRGTSLVVMGFVAVMALLLGLVDLALSGIVRLILS